KAGTLIDVSLRISPVKDAAGRILGASAIARDITSRKRAELAQRLSEARWKAIVDSAVDGIVGINSEGLIATLNPAAAKMFGYTETEVIGHNVKMLMPAPYREDHDGYLERYLRTGERRIIGIGRDVTGLRRDGRTFPVHLSVGEIRVGDERH